MSKRNKNQEQVKRGLSTGQKVAIGAGAVGGTVGLGFGLKKLWDHFREPKFEDFDDEFFEEPNAPSAPESEPTPEKSEPEPEVKKESEEKLYKDFISGKPVTPVYPEKMNDGQLSKVYRDTVGMLYGLRARLAERTHKYGWWNRVYDLEREAEEAMDLLEGTEYATEIEELATDVFWECRVTIEMIFTGEIPVEYYSDGSVPTEDDVSDLCDSLAYHFTRLSTDLKKGIAEVSGHYSWYMIDFANLLTILGSGIKYDPQGLLAHVDELSAVQEMAREEGIELHWNFIPEIRLRQILNERSLGPETTEAAETESESAPEEKETQKTEEHGKDCFSVFEATEEDIDRQLHDEYNAAIDAIKSMREMMNYGKFHTNFPFALASDREKCVSVAQTIRDTKYYDPFARMMSKIVDDCNDKLIAVLSGACPIECYYTQQFTFETFDELSKNLEFISDEVYGAKVIGDDNELRDAARRYTEQFMLLLMYIGGGCKSYESVPISAFRELLEQYKVVRKFSTIPGSGDYLWDLVPVADIEKMLETMEKLEQTDVEESPQESVETEEPVESNPEPTEEEPVPEVTEEPTETVIPSEDELIALRNAIDKITIVLEKDEIKAAAEQYSKYCEPYYSKRDLLDKDLADRLVDLSRKLIAKAVENGWTVSEKPAEAEPEVTEEVVDDEGDVDYSSLIHDMQRIEEMMSRNDIMGAKNVFAKCCVGYMSDSMLVKDNERLYEDLHTLAARIDEAWDKLPKRGSKKRRK